MPNCGMQNLFVMTTTIELRDLINIIVTANKIDTFNTLVLCNITINENVAQVISNLVTSNKLTRLRIIRLANTHINQIVEIMRAISTCNSLQVLKLPYFPIQEQHTPLLVNAVVNNKNLEYLDISSIPLKDSLPSVGNAVCVNNSIKTLRADCTALFETCKKIIEQLQPNTSLVNVTVISDPRNKSSPMGYNISEQISPEERLIPLLQLDSILERNKNIVHLNIIFAAVL